MKIFAPKKSYHGRDQHHGSAVTLLAKDKKDRRLGCKCHHSPAVTTHHDYNQDQGQAVKPSDVKVQDRRSHHGRDNYRISISAHFEDHSTLSALHPTS